MLQEALEVFEKKLSKNNRLVIDAYSLKNGTYRLIEMSDDDWRIRKTIDIFYDKKRNEFIGNNDEDFHLIRQLDYYSKLLEMNKSIDQKKVIHTNNYLSIAVKKENLINQKLTPEIIKNYYQILKNPLSKYEKKAKSKKLYLKVEEKLGQVDIDLLEKIEEYILNYNIFDGIDFNKKDYVKIFFVFPDEEKTLTYYKRENERYLLPNLYNSNDYNVEDEGKIFGLSNNNMGMNAKKPFLENKTRKVKVPYLLNQEKALLQSQFFDYLWGRVSQGQYDFYIVTDSENEDIKSLDEIHDYITGYYIRCRKEKNEVEIAYADNVTSYSHELEKPFVLKNYIGLSDKMIDKSPLKYDVDLGDIWKISHLIDSIFFDGKLHIHYYSKVEDIQINDSVLKRCLLENRNILIAWFYTGKINGLKSSLDKFSFELILNALRNDDIYKAQRQCNLRWSLLTYFDDRKEVGESMVKVRDDLRKHINLSFHEEWDFNDDQEYAYAVGQIINYFTSLNKSANKSQAFVNRYLNAKNVDILKKKLVVAYKKYNYLIPYNNSIRVSELMTHIMVYRPEQLDIEYIVAGFTATSLIYEKKQEDNKDE